jgi:hypothetical protein
MIKVAEVIGGDATAPVLVVRFKNLPGPKDKKLLLEASFLEEAGKEKIWGNGYTYRLDKRPDAYGGHQIHIFNKNQAWAYRFNGTKSEPGKYTIPATNAVKDIVRDVFKLGSDTKIESYVISASSSEILMEFSFA